MNDSNNQKKKLEKKVSPINNIFLFFNYRKNILISKVFCY